MSQIIFVDANDTIIGHGTRQEAVEMGIIHRIARVYVRNYEGKLLIQKRSATQVLPGKWDQSAAGHVEPGESYVTAAEREAAEEIGIKNIRLTDCGTYYSEESEGGITRKRYNGLFETTSAAIPALTDGEVSETKWVTLTDLKTWMTESPEDFTQGFIKSFQYYQQYLAKKQS